MKAKCNCFADGTVITKQEHKGENGYGKKNWKKEKPEI